MGAGRLSSGPSWQQDAHPSAPWQRWHRQAQGELGRCIQGQIRRQAQKEEAQIGERGRWHPQRDRGTQARVTRRELVCHVIATRRHTLCNYMIGGSVRTPILNSQTFAGSCSYRRDAARRDGSRPLNLLFNQMHSRFGWAQGLPAAAKALPPLLLSLHHGSLPLLCVCGTRGVLGCGFGVLGRNDGGICGALGFLGLF